MEIDRKRLEIRGVDTEKEPKCPFGRLSPRLNDLVSPKPNDLNLDSTEYAFLSFGSNQPKFQTIWTVFDPNEVRESTPSSVIYMWTFCPCCSRIGASKPKRIIFRSMCRNRIENAVPP